MLYLAVVLMLHGLYIYRVMLHGTVRLRPLTSFLQTLHRVYIFFTAERKLLRHDAEACVTLRHPPQSQDRK